MKIRKSHAAWAVKLWVFASVFLLPFIGGWEIVAWIALGAAFGLAWNALPEEQGEEPPVEPLPFQDQYRDKEIPRRNR